jgi:diguanylate cyclase (GGDEF)-like protein
MNIFDKGKKRDWEESKKVQQKQHTVMIVDDEPDQLKELRDILSKDYNVIAAHDGKEALDIVKEKMEHQQTISVILSDIRMPRLDGFELLESINEIIPITRFIFLTGYPEYKQLNEDLIDKGKLFHCLVKPISIESIKKMVKNAINEFERIQSIIERIFIDKMTGLKRREFLETFIDEDIAKVDRDYEDLKRNPKEPAAIPGDLNFLMLDIDYFKEVNDIYGHDAGDKVLKQFADIIREVCRGSDFLVRWGGEEFLVVSRFMPKTEAPKLAERLRNSMEKYAFDLGDGKTIKKTCSIGFASYPFHPSGPKTGNIDWKNVINIADKALYTAKYSGRNAWIGFNATHKTIPENLYARIKNNIKQLLDNRELEYVTSFSKKTKILWENPKQ